MFIHNVPLLYYSFLFFPNMILIIMITTATISNTCIKPPSVFDDTIPKNHKSSKTIKIPQSIFAPLIELNKIEYVQMNR